MKAIYIKYYNYRCFKDAEIKFNTTPDKNIALIVGPNGGGKTEMLFSFWWVLYGFRFETLHGKEQTPYSLNSTLYHDLENSIGNGQETCSVEFCFEEADEKYVVTKEEIFYKKNKKITSEIQVQLTTYKNNIKSLPERDPQKVEQRLLRVIPINVLHGIVFDGERMKQLSSNTDSAKLAVEGVIKEITNEELFVMLSTELKEVKDDIASGYNKLDKKNKNNQLDYINAKIIALENQIGNDETILAADRKRYEEVIGDLGIISTQLEELKEVQKYEKERKKLNGELVKKQNDLRNSIETFSKDLSSCYLLLSNNILNDVKKTLDDIDIPAGLNCEAVKSILKRSTCLCGADLTGDVRCKLEELISSLPPDNINSTLNEMTRQMELAVKEDKEKLKRSFNAVKGFENEIENLKKQIAEISKHISSSASSSAAELEEQNNELQAEKYRLEAEIAALENNISTNTKLLETLKRQREAASKSNTACQLLIQKENFVVKCQKAINAISEYNKMLSLCEINGIINDAYTMLSEDSERGRKLYIVGHNKKKKYLMVSYFEDKYNKLLAEWKKNGEYTSRLNTGETKSEIEEAIKIKISESNSTGQSKVNSLAFAKSILDFSSRSRSDDEMYITKSYPFFIDSPFTELDEGNQTMTAKNIHNFAEQIILMASEQSLMGVSEYINPYVGCKAEFEKNERDNYSIIKQD